MANMNYRFHKNKPEKLSAFKRELRATIPKYYASALYKCYASAMQELWTYNALEPNFWKKRDKRTNIALVHNL